jgi:hypothetical protein
MAVSDQADREHHALLQAAMAAELARREAAGRTPGVGFLINTDKVSYQAGAPWLLGAQGLGFGGQGFTPPGHAAPTPVHADPLVGGVLAAGAVVVAPGSRKPPVSRLVATTSAPVVHNRSAETVYVSPEVGTSAGLLRRFLAWIRGGRA